MKITVANKIDKAFKRASQYFIMKADSKTPNKDLVQINLSFRRYEIAKNR